MNNFLKLLILSTFMYPFSLNAYKIDIIYRSVHNYKTIESAYKLDSHIKEINSSPRIWESINGNKKEARLIELIGPNKAILEIESPIARGVFNKHTVETSVLAKHEQEYVRYLYFKLKNSYFMDFALQQYRMWESKLASQQEQIRKIDSDIAAINRQREAYLSRTVVNVDVVVNISNVYGMGHMTSSVTTNNIQSTKIFDDLIARLNFRRRDLPRLINVSNDALRVNREIFQLAKINYQNNEKTYVKNSTEKAPPISDKNKSVRDQLEKIKKLYDEGLLSKDVYESQQREILSNN